MPQPLDLLLQRRSIPSAQLGEPGPDTRQRCALLEASLRVPDHGKLDPFRLIQLDGQAKLDFGERMAARALERDPQLSDNKREKERQRYLHTPLVIVVVASPVQDTKVPVLEQQLTAGCVAYNLLLGAQALGFGAQWLTGWAAYDEEAARALGLASHEQVIGFVHIGTPRMPSPERKRPALADILVRWTA